jgi:hypothetical protein
MRRDAQALFEACGRPISCIIHDLSNGGARLGFTEPVSGVPRTFTLVLFKDSVQRECEMVWTDGHFVGVKFISQWFGTKSSEQVSVSKSRPLGLRERRSLV